MWETILAVLPAAVQAGLQLYGGMNASKLAQDQLEQKHIWDVEAQKAGFENQQALAQMQAELEAAMQTEALNTLTPSQRLAAMRGQGQDLTTSITNMINAYQRMLGGRSSLS